MKMYEIFSQNGTVIGIAKTKEVALEIINRISDLRYNVILNYREVVL